MYNLFEIYSLHGFFSAELWHTHFSKAVKNLMYRQISVSSILLLSTLLLYQNSSYALESKVTEADNLIKQWLSIERQRNALTLDWQSQKPILEQRLTLLKQEKKQLKGKSSQHILDTSDVDKKRNELITSQNNMESNQAQIEGALVKYYQIILQLHPQLPPPLFKVWQGALNDPTFKSADTSKKLTTLLKLLEQLNDFNQRISHSESTLTVEGSSGEKEIMVRQLYMGLSQAWYVSLDGLLTGRGFPEKNGWRWISDNQVSGNTVNNAIAMIERNTEAQFLTLPISLDSDSNNE